VRLGPYFFWLQLVGKKYQMTRRPIYQDNGHHSGQKIRAYVFFYPKISFQPFFSFFTQNTLETMINLSIASKNPINYPKKLKST